MKFLSEASGVAIVLLVVPFADLSGVVAGATRRGSVKLSCTDRRIPPRRSAVGRFPSRTIAFNWSKWSRVCSSWRSARCCKPSTMRRQLDNWLSPLTLGRHTVSRMRPRGHLSQHSNPKKVISAR